MLKWIMNNPDDMVDENMAGYVKAHSDILELLGSRYIGRRHKKPKGRVKLVGGGGSGHEPAGGGFIGTGMSDLCICGDIFTAPSGANMFKALQFLDDGSPILHTVANHAGDVMNANIAKQFSEAAGMDYHQEIFYDDIASAPKDRMEERRGTSGSCLTGKITGAAAELGWSINEVIRIFRKGRDNVRSFGVAISGCIHPITGQMMMELPDDKVEMGMGVHGEGGAERGPMKSSKEFAQTVSEIILNDMPLKKGSEVVVLLNGSGGMTQMELSILFNDVYGYLTNTKGLIIHDNLLGNIGTTLNMRGFSMSICKIDEELKMLWDEPCHTSLITKLPKPGDTRWNGGV
jgi:dihydroxyacetone kinase